METLKHTEMKSESHESAAVTEERNEKQVNEVVIDVSEGAGSSAPSPEELTTSKEHRSWSILTRFHAGYFRISLSLCGQALLWKTLSEAAADGHHKVLVIPSAAFILLWSISLFILAFLSLLYLLRCLFHFQLVKNEFLHQVGVNYLFAPWISWLLVLQSSPFIYPSAPQYLILWWVFVVPVVVLDVKLYGQWFTKGKAFLSMVANPSSQLSVIGNLVGARAAALMGWKECAVFMFSLGMTHYLVLFVTLYQRFSGSDHLPAMLRPVFFLFIAVPSTASLAWDSIAGGFDTASKMLFFLSLFLFASLASRPYLFKRSMRKFNVAWWAYSFPLSFLALASIGYAREVKGALAQTLMLVLLTLSVLVALSLMIFTVLNTSRLLPKQDPVLSSPSPIHCSQNTDDQQMTSAN